MVLDRDAILRSDDLKRKNVDIPEWKGSVIVQEMTSAGRIVLERIMKDDDACEKWRGMMVVLSVVDKDGAAVFTENDLPALGEKSPAALDRIAMVAQKLSGLYSGADEEAEKN